MTRRCPNGETWCGNTASSSRWYVVASIWYDWVWWTPIVTWMYTSVRTSSRFVSMDYHFDYPKSIDLISRIKYDELRVPFRRILRKDTGERNQIETLSISWEARSVRMRKCFFISNLWKTRNYFRKKYMIYTFKNIRFVGNNCTILYVHFLNQTTSDQIPATGCVPGEVKHLSTRRKRNHYGIPIVAASEMGEAQTGDWFLVVSSW